MAGLRRVSISVPLLGDMEWSIFQWVTVSLPLGFILAVWAYVLKVPWPKDPAIKAGLVTLVSILASLVFASVLLRALRRAYDGLEAAVTAAQDHAEQLNALHEASVAMTQDLDLDVVLGRVVDLSRNVIRARYAALQVYATDAAESAGHSFLTSGMSPEEVAAIGQFPTGRGVLSVVARSQKSVRLDDLTQHPLSVGFPEHHPVMRTFLGTPIRFRDRLLGHIYLTEKEGGQPFTEGDEATLERFAAQAGAVIANATLLQEVARLAQAAERERIGRDLHDGTLQELYAIALGLQAALFEWEQRQVTLTGGHPDSDPATVERASGAIDAGTETEPLPEWKAMNQALESIRKVMTDIRHYVFDEDLRSLPQQVELAPKLFAAVTGLDQAADVEIVTDLGGLGNVHVSEERAQALVQIVREALSNAVRHSGATQIRFTAEMLRDLIQVSVSDDGRGFDVAGSVRAGHGLSNMRVRAEALGGSFTIASRRRGGTVLQVTIPKTVPPRVR